MIHFVKGNLLNADAEALVNTVNTVGVMGKGIALQFKNRFPQNFKIYKDACKAKTFQTGQVLTVREGDLMASKYIINFPTKAHWRSPSKLEYISSGLSALRDEIISLGIKSIAIPPLGCGNGGLEWTVVRPMIVSALEDLNIEIFIYEPNIKVKEQLQKESKKKEVKLTPARAMMLYLMYHYEAAGEQSSVFVANKLAYFLQRKGENLRLNFQAHYYGPYAVQVNHVLLHLNGTYLKGMEQNTAKPFEALQLNYDKYSEIERYINTKLKSEQKQRIDGVLSLIRRFESSYALELLATVDFIMDRDNAREVNQVIDSLSKWSSRKKNLFKSEHVQIAIDHLNKSASDIFTPLA